MEQNPVLTGHSFAADARLAVREFHAAVSQPETELVVFFCSSCYDLDALADEMRILFPATQVLGCTTAGEIGPSGYGEKSLSGASFAKGAFTAVVGLLPGLQAFDFARGHEFASALMRSLEARAVDPDVRNTFAFQLIDGLAVREEQVVHAFQNALGRIPLIGGSAGDDLRFVRTCVYHDGRFHTDAVVLALIHSRCPFRIFKTQHFVSDAERLVVTEADPVRRVVKEINGLPAVDEYARVIGVSPDQLGSFSFASSPVVVVIDGTDYVRSIQKANDDGSLTFYCAIEEGLVLRVAHGENLRDNLIQSLQALEQAIGPLQLVLACDCILRNLEVTSDGSKAQIGEIFAQHHAVGFSTYGEQYCGVHVNQTLTGIAIGR